MLCHRCGYVSRLSPCHPGPGERPEALTPCLLEVGLLDGTHVIKALQVDLPHLRLLLSMVSLADLARVVLRSCRRKRFVFLDNEGNERLDHDVARIDAFVNLARLDEEGVAWLQEHRWLSILL